MFWLITYTCFDFSQALPRTLLNDVHEGDLSGWYHAVKKSIDSEDTLVLLFAKEIDREEYKAWTEIVENQ